MVGKYATNNRVGGYVNISNITFLTYESCVKEGERYAARNPKWNTYHCLMGDK